MEYEPTTSVARLPMTSKIGMASAVPRGLFAGVVGTAVMTAFQKFVEMPLTGRADSYAPAAFAQHVLPVSPTSARGWSRLNYATHFALGGVWGTAYGVAAAMGFRGQTAVNAIFAVMYPGDVVLNMALGLYRPSTWTTQDWSVDLVEEYLQAQATGVLFDRVLDPRR